MKDLNDDYWGISNTKSKGFFISKTNSRTLPYKNRFQNSITFEMSLSQRYYYRVVYSALDFLSEIGGITSAISLVASSIVSALNFHGDF